MAASAYEAEARHFSVWTDGTVRGDDGDGGRLAASLRYAARLGGQVEHLLDVGALQEMATVSGEAITAGITRDDAGGIGLSVRVDARPHRRSKVLTVVGGTDVQVALAHCVQRVQDVPGVRWGAILATDTRVVAASRHLLDPEQPANASTLASEGVRAMAVLGAIDEPLRESWIRLSFARATLLVASVGTSCLCALADEVDELPFSEVLDEVRAILGTHDLGEAATLAIEPSESGTVAVQPPGTASPAPSGMRYRAPQPRTPRERKRGLFGR